MDLESIFIIDVHGSSLEAMVFVHGYLAGKWDINGILTYINHQ